MNVKQITEVLEPITDKSKSPKRALNKVAFRNGHGYACDGRIAVRIRLDDPNEEIPEEDGGCFPFDDIDGFLSEVETRSKWYTLDAEAVKAITDRFAKLVADEVSIHRMVFNSSFAECVCPHCGKTVWYDTIDDTIVKERVDGDPVDPKSVYFPGRIELGDANSDVGFGYIRAIIHVIGIDAQLALGDECEDGNRKLFFRSYDGSIVGVLMPVLVIDNRIYTPNWEIKCREVENV